MKTSKYFKVAFVLILAIALNLLVAPFHTTQAQAGCTKTWIGGVLPDPNAWQNAANWGPAGVPGSTHDVCINSGPTVVLNLTGNAKTVTIGAGQTLIVQGSGSGTGQLTAAGSFTNAGVINMESVPANGGAALVSSGVLTNTGTINSSPGINNYRSIQAALNNQGAININVGTEINKGSVAPSLKAHDIVFYVEGKDDKGRKHDDDRGPGKSDEEVSPTVVQIGVKNIIKANIYAPNGTVWLKEDTKGTGAFIGKRVRIGEKVELILDSAF